MDEFAIKYIYRYITNYWITKGVVLGHHFWDLEKFLSQADERSDIEIVQTIAIPYPEI